MTNDAIFSCTVQVSSKCAVHSSVQVVACIPKGLTVPNLNREKHGGLTKDCE